MDIKGTTRVCGLIGNPVGHSVSPAIHNNLARLTGKDMVYTTFKVEKGDVASAVRGAYSLNILGLNVTVPHKSEVIDSLVDIDPLAKAIGAVNTLVRVDGGFKGYNTDILGLARELEDEGIELADSKVIILGAGGAARAITFLCSSKNAQCVYLLNRTVDKAEAIAQAVNAHFNNSKLLKKTSVNFSYRQSSTNRYNTVITDLCKLFDSLCLHIPKCLFTGIPEYILNKLVILILYILVSIKKFHIVSPGNPSSKCCLTASHKTNKDNIILSIH